ncbi:hypothetical protein Pcinc_024772 [Petrolisthes cinctipes]|uniref:Uncharacterized protein n=1 Tax=Petrolisthes cinctipes TaxID=88211 RepID=A0AAE1F960_PETCI|nr:hypothetical protein Pcinc_024772 [Petrolisthes cinctipes]
MRGDDDSEVRVRDEYEVITKCTVTGKEVTSEEDSSEHFGLTHSLFHHSIPPLGFGSCGGRSSGDGGKLEYREEQSLENKKRSKEENQKKIKIVLQVSPKPLDDMQHQHSITDNES